MVLFYLMDILMKDFNQGLEDGFGMMELTIKDKWKTSSVMEKVKRFMDNINKGFLKMHLKKVIYGRME